MAAVKITLPRGVAVGDEWCRSAWLNSVTGCEEEFLLGDGKFLTAAARVTELLCRCLRRLGPVEPVDAQLVRRLSVGDRESLLLHLRRLTLGDRISCLLTCPTCGKTMDLDLNIGELLLAPYPHEETFHETTIRDEKTSYRVLFRPPNGEDQEVAAARALESLTSAAELVLKRCIAKVVSASGEELSVPPGVVLQELPERMAQFDPQAEVLLDLVCPECGSGFMVPFDIADYLFRELGIQEYEFYRGIHRLSFHYHWGEDAILKLDRRKRHIYLELLAEEMSAGSRLG
jgi:hypothetical protein